MKSFGSLIVTFFIPLTKIWVGAIICHLRREASSSAINLFTLLMSKKVLNNQIQIYRQKSHKYLNSPLPWPNPISKSLHSPLFLLLIWARNSSHPVKIWKCLWINTCSKEEPVSPDSPVIIDSLWGLRLHSCKGLGIWEPFGGSW